VSELTPSSLKRVMALRTFWVEYPTAAAICVEVWPRRLASSIWHRLTVKTFEERSPASKAARSSAVTSRTLSGFIPWMMPDRNLLQQPASGLH
jgi:hypothetical protein